ncbi:SPOR domain-containing protein [Saccharospirillum mangrovi]|uniref:SPOR domain-containing protein n=1 Tax=Saccharospirillum mangrovi TaxID=2161747 RepID=UPI000D3DBFD0|nr:SPOR domain-containing protein [Saccharospirillum mangrovi]
MARDYANKRQPEPDRSRVPRWVWIFTACASVAFVGFLYYLSQVPPDGSSSGTQALKERLQQALPEASINNDDSKNSSARTPTLEEAFEFYQLLKDDEVPVPAATPRPSTNSGGSTSPAAPASGNRWEIQVASFSDVTDAERLRAQLIINGLTNTHLTEADLGDRGIYHRVMVGPFSDRSQLNKAQDILADLNHQVMVRSLN